MQSSRSYASRAGWSKVKSTITVIGALAAGIAAFAVQADESPCFEGSVKTAVNSAYVSHNRIFSDTPVVQYDLWMQANLPDGFGWIGADVWVNQELNKRHSSPVRANGGKRLGGIGEFDYELAYGNSLGPVNFSASHRWYVYPRCGWASQKFWTLGVEYDNEFAVPGVKIFWEYGHDKIPDEAMLIDFTLSRRFDVTEDFSIALSSVTTLFTSQYAKYISRGNLDEAVFGGWDNGILLNYALTDCISLGARLSYLYRLDHRVRHCEGWDPYSPGGIHSAHNGLFHGGISLNISF